MAVGDGDGDGALGYDGLLNYDGFCCEDEMLTGFDSTDKCATTLELHSRRREGGAGEAREHQE